MSETNIFLPLRVAGQVVTVSTVPDLPTLGVVEGAIRFVDATQKLYYWSGATWIILDSGLITPGDVVGPASSTDTALARYNGITGKIIQNSAVTLSNAGALAGLGSLSFTSGVSLTSGGALLGLTALESGNPTIRSTRAGVSALNTVSGSGDTAFGYHAGLLLTTGQRSTFVGDSAGAALTTGSQNTAVGAHALETSNTASFNSAFGSNSLQSVTLGANNLGVGYSAAYQLTVGFQTTAVGTTSLPNLTTGNDNTAVGYFAGQNIVTGSDNTFIGFQAHASGDFSNSAAIGANAIVGQNNALILGSGVNVGIGTSTPTRNLEVVGTVRVSGGGGQFADLYYAGNDFFIDSNIGTLFSITQDDVVIGAWGGGGGGTHRFKAASAGVGNANRDGLNLTLASGESTGNGTGSSLIFQTGPTGSAGTSLNALVERVRITGAGFVGIGTSAPTSHLSVGASSQFQVNATGNLIKLNDVTYSWPASQGAATTILINDGSGNLTWGGAGEVTGPTSSTDNAITRFDSTTGKIIQNSVVTLSDTGVFAAVSTDQTIAFQPNGAGSLVAESSTATPGNARGANAVDLQLSKTGATKVASGANSTIVGGQNNSAQGNLSFIGGGSLNTTFNTAATVAGGQGNFAYGNSSSIGGGFNNTVDGETSSISGGEFNYAVGERSFIGGGSGNTADNESNAVVGGQGNTASGQTCSIGGGTSNQIQSGSYGAIGGGQQNTLGALAGVIAGGGHNTLYSDGYASILGGAFNEIGGSSISIYATIGGGNSNKNNNNYSVISGGRFNTTAGGNQYISLGGGDRNSSSGNNSTISGGSLNANIGGGATIAGGTTNLITGFNQAFAVGNLCWVTGNSGIAMGQANQAAHTSALALGKGARSSATNDFVLGNDTAGTNVPCVDNVHLRMAGDVSSLHIGRSTNQPLSTTAQTATITIATPSVLTVAAAPADGSTVRLTTTGTLPTSISGLTASVSMANPAVFTGDTAWANGTQIVLNASQLPGGFVNGLNYYVVNTSGVTFQLALVPGGTALPSAGIAVVPVGYSVSGLVANQRYFVINSSGTTFNLSYVVGGPAISLYGTQSGTHTATTQTYNNASAQNKLHLHTRNIDNQSKSVSLSSPNLTSDVDLVLPNSVGTSGQVLVTDGSGNLSWSTQNVSGVYKTNWINADGNTKSITHSLGTRDVMIQVYNNDGVSWETVFVSDNRTTVNSVNLSSVSAPPVAWRVLITAL